MHPTPLADSHQEQLCSQLLGQSDPAGWFHNFFTVYSEDRIYRSVSVLPNTSLGAPILLKTLTAAVEPQHVSPRLAYLSTGPARTVSCQGLGISTAYHHLLISNCIAACHHRHRYASLPGYHCVSPREWALPISGIHITVAGSAQYKYSHAEVSSIPETGSRGMWVDGSNLWNPKWGYFSCFYTTRGGPDFCTCGFYQVCGSWRSPLYR